MNLEKKTLYVGAHYDDADFGPGGTLRLIADSDAHVGIAILTDSNNGNGKGEERLTEQRSSAEIIGVGRIFPVGRERAIPDGGLSLVQFIIPAFQGLYQILDAAEAAHKPYKRIITFGPDGLTGHPDHSAASDIVNMAYRAMTSLEEAWQYGFSAQERDDFLHSYGGEYVYPVPDVDMIHKMPVNIRGTIFKKRAALNAHESQKDDMDKRLGYLPDIEYFTIQK